MVAAALATIALAGIGGSAPIDVTGDPFVQHDLAAAVHYWHVHAPALTPACAPETVTVGPMMDGYGVANVIISAQHIWAETAVGDCTIALSFDLWHTLHQPNRIMRYDACLAIVHEYGHTLGLPDETSVPMMSGWSHRHARECWR